MQRYSLNGRRFVGVSLIALMAALGAGQLILSKAAAQGDGREAPRFEVDPLWPKPMKNNWVLGQAIGVNVDSQDHIWIIHRGWDPAALDNTELADPLTGNNAGMHVGECCNPSPPVMEFDQEGNMLQAWGGPSESGEYEWPASNHGIVVDDEGFVYIGGNGAGDSQILKFTSDGKFVAQWGKANARLDPDSSAEEPKYLANSMDMENFGRVAKIQVDDAANEGYVADGYLNHRVAVIDIDSGEIKRQWGAYGNPPTDEVLPPYDPQAELPQQFRNPVHCAMKSRDGMVYVCDRANDRVQIFDTEGKFVNEVIVAPETLADGSVWDIAFSPDEAQQFLYMTDGVNEHVRVFDRASMEELYNFGYGGRQPGMFLGVHSIAVDSSGNIYTTETYTGKRLQKFVNKGMGPITTASIGAPWPNE